MQFLDFSCFGPTGAALGGASVTVYQTGTSTRANIYDVNGVSISNPTTAGLAGNVGFSASNGIYDIQITSSDGTYNAPLWQKVQIYDLAALGSGVRRRGNWSNTVADYVANDEVLYTDGNDYYVPATFVGAVTTGTAPGTAPWVLDAAGTSAAAAAASALEAENYANSLTALSVVFTYEIYRGNWLLTMSDAAGNILAQMNSDSSFSLLQDLLRLNTGHSMAAYEVGGAPYLTVTDAIGNIVGMVPDPAVAELQATSASGTFYETAQPSGPLFTDQDGNILGQVDDGSLAAEVVAARGDRTDLNTRLSQGLTPYGDPLDPYYGRWAMRVAHEQMEAILQAQLGYGDTAQLNIGAGPAHSYVAGHFWTEAFTAKMQAKYGFAGLGWVSFGWSSSPTSDTWGSGHQPASVNGCARADLAVPYFVGTWTTTYNTPSCNMPDMSYVSSSTANNTISFAVPAGHSSAKLAYLGDGTGVVQVSWDNGVTWSSNIDLTATVPTYVSLPSVPAGTGTLVIKVVSGNVSIAGVLMQSTANGVCVHNLGAGGSQAVQWAELNQTTWTGMLAPMNIDSYLVELDANDQGAGILPETFGAAIGTILTNLQTVFPSSDQAIICDPENQRTTNVYPMSEYTQAQREVAVSMGVGVIDLQYDFGSPADFAYAYAYANPTRPWYRSDLLHPDQMTGGRAIANSVFRFLQA